MVSSLAVGIAVHREICYVFIVSRYGCVNGRNTYGSEQDAANISDVQTERDDSEEAFGTTCSDFVI